jgi:hypothetical protein
MSDYVLVQIRLQPAAATLDAAAARLGVAVGDLDAAYGLVPTDAAAGLYALMLRAARAGDAAARLAGGDPAEGVFANPRVAPFDPSGPPRP